MICYNAKHERHGFPDANLSKVRAYPLSDVGGSKGSIMTSNGKTTDSRDPGDVVVGSFTKNAFEEVRVDMRTYHGYDLVHVRVWAQGREAMYPTRKGIAIQRSDLPKLIALLEGAQVHVEADRAKRGDGS